MKLYFENSKGKERVIAESLSTRKDVYDAIHKFLDEHNFKCYYSRELYNENQVTFDVGSHTEFFHLKGTEEEITSFRNDAKKENA